MASKFRQLSEILQDIKIEWLLLRIALVLLAVESCEPKQLSERTSWSNHDVMKIPMQKVLRPCCKTGHYLICNSILPGAKS